MALESKRLKSLRRGSASVELAILLPLLCFLLVIGVDFARAFFHSQVVANGARNGAVYGATDSTHAADDAGIRAAALKDMTDLSPAPTVTTERGTDAAGNAFVRVTVDYPFKTITSYPFVPSAFTVRQSCQVRVEPETPRPGSY